MNSTQFRSSRPFRQKQIPSSRPRFVMCFNIILLLALLQTSSLFAQKKLSFPLDPLTEFPKNWEMTPKEFESQFGKTKVKLYEWLTADKSRVKFSRSRFRGLEIDLTLFDGTLRIEEAIIDFHKGKLNLMTFSIYNRGDSGKTTSEAFNKLHMTSGKAMSEVLKVKPSSIKADKLQGFLTAGFLWNSPLAVALLEYNEGALKSPKPEFLRLRIARKGARGGLAASMTNSRGGASVSLNTLTRFITKDSKGNVFIKGLPMVDQGNKGYCVVASVQRLFEHYGIGADMHQIAEVTNASPALGTSSLATARELDKVDYRFKTRLKIVGMRDSGRMTEVDKRKGKYYVGKKMDERKFMKDIRASIDDGIPLLWSLELGRYPEEPNLRPQTSGGHMRLIIGYNDKEQKLIFSDSWGAGHEFKRMKMSDAYKATRGVFSLRPTVS